MMLGELARRSRESGKNHLDQHDALCPRRISAVEDAQQKALVRPCVALTVLGVDFPHDLDEAPQTSPR